MEKDNTLLHLYYFMCFLVLLLIAFPPVYSLSEGFQGFKFVLLVQADELVASGRLMLLFCCMGLWTLALKTIHENSSLAPQED